MDNEDFGQNFAWFEWGFVAPDEEDWTADVTRSEQGVPPGHGFEQGDRSWMSTER